MKSTLIPWGVATTVYTSVRARGLTDLKSNPTIATGDFRLSIDGGTFANVTPTVSPASGPQLAFALTASQCEGTRLYIVGIDLSATKEWEDVDIWLHTPLAEGGVVGKITSGTPTTTSFISTYLTGANTDHYALAWFRMLSGTCAGAVARCSAFNAGTDAITFDSLYPWPAAPAVGDVFEKIG